MASIKNLFSLCHLLLVLLIAKADSKCQKSYPCRNFTIEFPFTDINRSKCGLFPVNCDLHQENPRVYFGAREFPMDLVKKVSANKFLIHDPVLARYFNGNNCFSFGNVSLLESPSVSFTFSPNLTSFSCYNPTQEIQNQFAQYHNKSCDVLTIYYYKTDEAPAENAVPPGCTMNQIPIKSDQDFGSDVFNLLSPNFTLEWHVSEDCNECHSQGGQCITNNKNEFFCKRGNLIVSIH